MNKRSSRHIANCNQLFCVQNKEQLNHVLPQTVSIIYHMRVTVSFTVAKVTIAVLPPPCTTKRTYSAKDFTRMFPFPCTARFHTSCDAVNSH